MRYVVSAALVVLVSAFIISAQITRADEIKKTIASYDKAWNAKDVKTIERLLAPKYVYFTSDGETTDRKKTLEFLASTDYKLTFAERSEVEVLHVDQTVAIVSSRWKGKGTFGEVSIDDDQRCGLVLARMDKLWKLLSEHCTQIVTK